MRTKTVGRRRNTISTTPSTPATPSISTPQQDDSNNQIVTVGDGDRSPHLRKDAVWNRWVIFSPGKSKRPCDFKYKPSFYGPQSIPTDSCSYCIGNEHESPTEIFRFPYDDPDWTIRVIENNHPALSCDLPEPNNAVSGPVLDGFGFHDVVIETPVHSIQLVDLSPEQIGQVFSAYTHRIRQLSNLHSIKYVQVFKNNGASVGASMSHSHSQMLALPIIPPSVSSRLGSMKDYFIQSGRCSVCESQREDLLIDVSPYFSSLVPFAATFPFEIWIVPRYHSAHFHELDEEMAVDLGGLLKRMLKKMSLQLNKPPVNFTIHTSPLHGSESELAYAHWFIQIVPQITGAAGFELGSGCYINPILPEDAAKVLREVNVPEIPSNKTVDYTDVFTTTKLFASRDDLVSWARAVGREHGFVVVIARSDTGEGKGRKKILILTCEKGGKYRRYKRELARKVAGSKKCGCPFRLKGRPLRNGQGWKLTVLCGFHNHEVGEILVSHSYAARLTPEEKSLVCDLTRNMESPKTILQAIKERNKDNISSIRQVYNARQAFRISQKSPETELQLPMDMSVTEFQHPVDMSVTEFQHPVDMSVTEFQHPVDMSVD